MLLASTTCHNPYELESLICLYEPETRLHPLPYETLSRDHLCQQF